MALIATPRASNANSYNTIAQLDAIFAGRLNATAWDDSLQQEEAAIQATYRLDQYDYVGITADEYLDTDEPTQALKWPRVLNDDGELIRNYGGTKQVETATIVGTITGDGDATVTVTGAALVGSPIVLSVPVLNGDTPTVTAGKIRTALNANSAITDFAAVGGTGAAITLTRVIAAANDETMNLAYTNGTCTGLTPGATSANTTEGALYAIPFEIRMAHAELVLALLAAGGEAVAAGTVSELQIGRSVTAKFATGTEAVDTSVDYSGLPIQAARFLKGLRLYSVLA